jgi:hypothetical protein
LFFLLSSLEIPISVLLTITHVFEFYSFFKNPCLSLSGLHTILKSSSLQMVEESIDVLLSHSSWVHFINVCSYIEFSFCLLGLSYLFTY